MNCERVNEILYLFFDNELEAELLTPFRSHTDGCPDCARRLDYTRKLLFLVRQGCSCQRRSAPERLRIRILASLPHRRSAESFH
jgi:mycothiol system anti-sigma-R factor